MIHSRRLFQDSVLLLLFACLFLVGCVATPDANLTRSFYAGDYGKARVYLSEIVDKQSPSRSGQGGNAKVDRSYLLNHLRLMMTTLADGYSGPIDQLAQDSFDIYRTQGINADKTVSSVVLNEDLKVWKGEPFEQAMGLCYIGLHYGIKGEWGNMRAATEAALFQLRDYGLDENGEQYTAESLANKSAHAIAESEAGEDADEGDAVLDESYTVRKTNFTLGYVLNGIANWELGRKDEANERFADAIEIDPAIEIVVQAIQEGQFNTIFVVDYGRGPRKIGTGPDNSIAQFVPLTPSDGALLTASVDGVAQQYSATLDLNTIASDLMWNNLEDIRLAKSHIGSALIAAAAATSANSNSESQSYAALGMMLAGLVAKAGAHADTRYCEIMPQRIYVAPVNVSNTTNVLALEVGGRVGSHMKLTGIDPPAQGHLQVRYVRLPTSPNIAVNWSANTVVQYANDYTREAGVRSLPYILGGDCVRQPSQDVLADYQRAGYLTGFTVNDLIGLYQLENIELSTEPGQQPGLHVLEGGNSLISPAPGTAGFARLFFQHHPPYLPRSKAVRDLMKSFTERVGEE